MKILGLASYPVEAAATRFRLAQFVEPLAERGIQLDIEPFLSSKQFREFYAPGGAVRKALGLVPAGLRRIGDVVRASRYDAVIVQREAVFFGPAVFEWLIKTVGHRPMVLDLDDATYVSYLSPSYGRVGSLLKFFGKTNKLIDRADLVTCGNRFIAEYCERRGAKTAVIPTIADPEVFRPSERENKVPVVGWIGTHSTYPFLESIFPVLESLAEKHRFVLKIVGAQRPNISLKNIDIINEAWALDREVADFQSLDIGVYPITVSGSASKEWLQGKSGFKAIQYLAVGVPFVMSPVGVCAEIGEPGVTHFNAVTSEDWYNALARLLSDGELRKRMGEKGREHSLANYNVPMHAARLADLVNGLVAGRQ